MPVTNRPNGAPIYFYTNEIKKENHIAAVKDNPPLSRKQRRKIERKLNRIRNKEILGRNK